MSEQWQHLAHSLKELTVNGSYSFRVPALVSGVRVSLKTADGQKRHGLIFRSLQAQVSEDGERLGPLLALASSDYWHLVRIGSAVYYCRADAVPTNEAEARAAAFWISRIPIAGALRLHADLFSPGDKVADARMDEMANAGPVPLPPSFQGATARLLLKAAARGAAGGAGKIQAAASVRVWAVQPEHLAQVKTLIPVPRVVALGEPVAMRVAFSLRPFASALKPNAFLQLADGVAVGDKAEEDGYQLRDYARALDKLEAAAERVLSIVDGMAAGDGLALTREVSIAECSVAGDEVGSRAVLAVADGAKAWDAVRASQETSLADGVRALDSLTGVQRVDVDCGAIAGDAVRPALNALLSCGAVGGDAVQARNDSGVSVDCGAIAGDAVRVSVENVAPLECGAIAGDELITNQPGVVAWVMNAETGAVSWWDNWQFTSAVQLPDGRVLAVGPHGLSEWAGESDDGQDVQAHITWGLQEFGGFDDNGSPVPLEKMKRVTQMTVGYHAKSPLVAELHAFGRGQAAAAFAMPARVAGQALYHVNHRIIPAKGLLARYWRVQVSGKGPWQVHGITVDVAASMRRV